MQAYMSSAAESFISLIIAADNIVGQIKQND